MRSRRTGAWVKGDVSWDAVRRPGGPFVAEHARWFAELHALTRDVRTLTALTDSSEWIVLDTVDSALLWPHLVRAVDIGVEFIGTRAAHPVSLAREAAVAVTVEPAPADAWSLALRVRIDDEPVDAASVRPIGRTGIYAFGVEGGGIRLTLAPITLGDAAHALLTAGAPLAVPAADRGEFLREYYPRIARELPLEPAAGVSLPAPTAPALVLSVAHRPSHQLDFAFAWHYPGLGRFTLAEPVHPDRDDAFERALLADVEQVWAEHTGAAFAGAGTLRNTDAAEFAVHVLTALATLEGVRVETTGDRPRYHELTGIPEITVSTVESTDADWFDLGVIVTIDGRSIPFTPLFTALTLQRKKMLLADGAYFSLAHPALQRLRDLIDEAAEVAEWETGPRISRAQTALWADFEDLADVAEPAVAWRALAQGLRNADSVPETVPPAGLDADLRPYQRAGLDWLAFLWRHRLGGILADDMGLGKTLQLLALIQHTREAGETRPFLVVAPTSVVSTWRSESARFTPGLRVRSLTATRARRAETVAAAASAADIVVTSYAVLRLDAVEFTAQEWAGVVLDEAQFVKNPQTKLHRSVKDLRADVTFAVTGTPLENSLTELWALLSLSAPGLFPSARRFREEYVGPIEQGKVPENQEGGPYRAARLERLRRRIRPLVLRRTKELVAPELPPTQEQLLHIELAPAHRAIYDTVLQRERQKVLGLLEDLDRHRFIVFRSLTLLRMLSLAPELVDPAHTQVASSKLDALVEHLAEIVAEGHRALVFSQFTSYLDIVQSRLDAADIAVTRLDGSTRRRDDVIAAFREGHAPVFLISLKAGGFGLTLTEADYVFLLDPWWNPAAESQAVDRAHRIGQDRTVMVYRMIAAGTIEEKVVALQERKARLFQAVMDDEALFGQSLTADDIRGLLED